MIHSEKLYWVALNAIPYIQSLQFHALRVWSQNNLEKVFHATRNELLAVPQLHAALCDQLLNSKRWLTQAEEELKKIEKLGIKLICYGEESYPLLLKEISDPPPLLYIWGELPKTKFHFGFVGTRQSTPYGLEVTEFLCRELAKYSEITIVSGLARGIDTKVHEAVLESRGKTMAVVGNGLSVFYPKENQRLYEKISKYGAVISEFPLASKPEPHHFPRRNRIISGLCQGIVVIEAPKKSGALITAKCALDQGREVFCVPGSIFSRRSEGTHRLIQQGAKLILEPRDILDEFDFKWKKENLMLNTDLSSALNEKEMDVFRVLGHAHFFEELIEETKLSINDLSEMLLAFEMKGLIYQKQNQYYRKVPCSKH